MADDFGPLPEGDRQDTLQQLSLKALRNALPEGKFLFRDERADDKGVGNTRTEAPRARHPGSWRNQSWKQICGASCGD